MVTALLEAFEELRGVFIMSMLTPRLLVAVLSSIAISLVALLMSFSAYSVAKSIQVAPTLEYTTISLGQKFNWRVAEVVEVQGNLYAYLGYEFPSHHLAKWLDGWMELSYRLDTNDLPINVTLAPYTLQVYTVETDLYLVAQFIES